MKGKTDDRLYVMLRRGSNAGRLYPLYACQRVYLFNGSPQLPEVTAEPSETNEEEGAERSRSDAAQPEQPVEAPEEEPENGAAPEDESAQPTEDGSAQNDDPGAAPEE